MLMNPKLFEKWLYAKPANMTVNLRDGSCCVSSSFAAEVRGYGKVISSWDFINVFGDYSNTAPSMVERLPLWFRSIIHQKRPAWATYGEVQKWFRIIFPVTVPPVVVMVDTTQVWRERPAGRVRDQRLAGGRASATRCSPKMRHKKLAAKRRPRTTSPRLAQRSPSAPAPAINN